MNILHLLGQHPAKTGSGTSLRAIIAGLNRHGHVQTAIYGLNEDQDPIDVGCPSFPVVFSKERNGFPLFGMSDTMPYLSFRFSEMTDKQFHQWSETFLEKIKFVMKEQPVDVIIAHHLHLLAAVAVLHFDIPVVGVSHGTDLAQLRKNPHHLSYVKNALKDMLFAATNSPEQNGEITELLGIPQERLRVLGGGFDPSVFYPGDPLPPPPFRFVYTGKISEHKGLRPLYYALADLKKEFSFVLTVAGTGEGEETESLIRLGERLGIPVEYRGFVPQNELAALYRTQHLFLLPSFAEGLSLATLEALGSGLFCVTSELPNLQAYLPEKILHSGQIVFAESYAEKSIFEENPAFFPFVESLKEKIRVQVKKMLSPVEKMGIENYNEITWFGRVDLLNQWISYFTQSKLEMRKETKAMSKHLFIPGPVDVSEDVLEKMATQQIGHRTKAATALQQRISEKLQKLFYTDNVIVLSTSSGSGLMEGAVRSFTKKRAAVFSIGSFGDRWYKMATANGVPADKFKSVPGEPTKVEDVDKALATGEYDVITITHNETSSGVMNDVEAIGALLKEKYPDVLLLVDAVSSMGGVKIDVDGWGIDCCITSTQKCLGLPAGLAVASISERAYERAKTVENRGLYFDMVSLYDFVKNKPYQYPSTPSLAHMFALDYQLDKIMEEGLENRFARHLEMAKRVRAWAKENFDVLVEDEKYMSQTLTTIKNTKGIDVGELNKKLGKYDMAISKGYGDLKDTTFRISHMADYTMDDINELLNNLDTVLKEA